MAHGETYEEFVAKFDKENPKTTDDCSTKRPRPKLSDLTRWIASTTHNITINYARY